jgi:large subunit ribosomal protein L38
VLLLLLFIYFLNFTATVLFIILFRYMDKYRDPKTIAKEFLLRKLNKEHPFCPPAPPLRFPNAVPIPRTVPSWLALEKKKARNKWGRINDM